MSDQEQTGGIAFGGSPFTEGYNVEGGGCCDTDTYGGSVYLSYATNNKIDSIIEGVLIAYFVLVGLMLMFSSNSSIGTSLGVAGVLIVGVYCANEGFKYAWGKGIYPLGIKPFAVANPLAATVVGNSLNSPSVTTYSQPQSNTTYAANYGRQQYAAPVGQQQYAAPVGQPEVYMAGPTMG
jgi:hypothetical protein